ncbi:MAG TPA: hypothetical protein DCM15_05045 [Cryomorphaceae bacterium]|nr:hypothetical protein [Cryomorphaceae bacterium]HBB81211.1 hypothetical protein [Cryomorphaceae bacterium]|tara:strand:- start:3410 stop:4072 length:663 start_codon:yes stop_codon:yes gene_type:complete
MHKPRVWVLPGMGADSRIFRSLKFPWSATFLEWLDPKDGETISSYADRLLNGHDIADNDLIFGYSFGGIVAQDWASRNKVQRVVLLNSLHHKSTVRPFFRLLSLTGILRWAPKNSVIKFIFFLARLHSKPTSQLDLTIEMMEQFDDRYYRWVLKQILSWNHPTPLCPIDVIQGEVDPVFLHSTYEEKRTWTLKDAAHLSFQTHGQEISYLLKEYVDPALV